MASKALFFAVSALAGAALVSAQAAPNWNYIPSACSEQCAVTVEAAYTCQAQFSGDTNSIYGCFCNNYPSDAESCASCLNDNNAAALGQLLTSTQTACPQAVQQCLFSCSFDTCAGDDVACQCGADYLANIYNCASCNTANNNAGTTQISDFESLQESCANQNYTGAAQSFTTRALPAATTDGYVAPTLTATGGGEAATGDVTGTDGPLAATGGSGAAASAGSATGAASSAAASAIGGASSASRPAASSTQRASTSAGSASQSAAASPTGGASSIAAPAFGFIAAVAGVAALF